MPGSNAACEVSCQLLQVNFAAIMIRADEAKTEAPKRMKAFHAHVFRKNFPRIQQTKKVPLLRFNQIFDFIPKKGYIASKFS